MKEKGDNIYTTMIQVPMHIGMLSAPVSHANIHPLLNLCKVIDTIDNQSVCIIPASGISDFSGFSKFKTIYIDHSTKQSFISRTLGFFLTQIKMSLELIRLRKSVSIWILYQGDTLILPVITGKILRKKMMVQIGGYQDIVMVYSKDPLLRVLTIFRKINLALTDKIIIYSPSLVKKWNLDRYSGKTVFSFNHFIDPLQFRLITPYIKRDVCIGYIGVHHKQKGILNFLDVTQVPSIKERQIHFFIGGSGELSDYVTQFIAEHDNDPIRYSGWIPHDKLPDYLNSIKLLVIPSYSEGLPNIMLEAMACGTPVLAAPVGIIPEIIEDGKTGFIMEDNSPECIAKNILRVLEYRDIESVIGTAQELIKRDFTLGRAVNRYEDILKK